MKTHNKHRGRHAAGMAFIVLAGCFGAAHADPVTRTVTFDYDANGQLIRENVEPLGDPNKTKITTEYVRDLTYGVVNKRRQIYHDPQTNLDVTRDVETIEYDTRNRYPTKVTNAKQQSENRTYDEGSGSRLTLTGPNQLTTTWTYDGWGRTSSESRADGTSTTWAYRQCVDTCLNSAVSVSITQNWAGASQTMVPSEVFSDALGRKVLSRSWGFDGTPILTEWAYDGVTGRLDHNTRPYFAGASTVSIKYFYDAIGRNTSVQSPNAAGNGYDVSTTVYDGQTTTFTNAKNQTRVEVRNGLGKLKSVTDDSKFTTSYLYDGFGNLLRTTDAKANQISVTYDNLGRKTQLVDPDLGTWIYAVNPLGQTYSQTDAKSQTTTYTFDELGRMIHRFEPDLDSNWLYDTATTGIGKLAEAYTLVNGAKDYRRTYGYDTVGRPAGVTIGLDWNYGEEYGYDSFGRQYWTTYRRSVRDGSGGPLNAVYKQYNAYGYVSNLSRNDGTASFNVWTALARDAEGRVIKEQLANGLKTDRGYNPRTGRIETIATGPDNGNGGASGSHQNDAYQYDSLGSVTDRRQLISTSGAVMHESFGYDNINRLTSSAVDGQAGKGYGYDSLGNLTSKDGVGSYAYPSSGPGSVRPHAVGGITGTVAGMTNPGFGYDNNGNLLDGLGRHYAWTSFNQAKDIDNVSSGTAVQRVSLLFGPDHQRTRRTNSPMSGGVPGVPTNTIYYGGAIEKQVDVAPNTTTIRTYLPMGLGYIEEVIAGTAVPPTASGTRNQRYFLNDHLGSPIAVVDDAQTVLQRMSYDAWGRRRNPDGTDDSWTTLGSLNNTQDHTGYTGHEQFDVLGLVHMNGRIYDPISAKFTSADPHVTDASDGQNYNRYSYVLNNPLAYTDPTGYFQETFQDHYQETGIPQGFGVSSFSAITLEQVIVWGSCSLNPVCVARNSALRASTALERITLAAAFRAMTGSFGTGLGIYGAFAASGVYAMGEHAKWEQSLHKGSYYVPSLADPFAFEHAILNAGADQGQDEEAVGASGEKTETEGGAATDSGEEAAKPKTGKNDTHIDQGAKQRAKEKLAEVKEELEKLKSTPNKTPAIKEQIAKLEKQVKHLQSKADAVGENHSMKPKR